MAGSRGRRPQAASTGAFVEPSLRAEAERIDRLTAELASISRQVEAVGAQGNRSMQRLGVVRYNPFQDTGSNQSFVLALLDSKGDGFVLSSLHSRQATRVFLKSLTGGRAEAQLSAEENEAIKRAMSGERGEGEL